MTPKFFTGTMVKASFKGLTSIGVVVGIEDYKLRDGRSVFRYVIFIDNSFFAWSESIVKDYLVSAASPLG
jgi:hypothetical protein